MKEKLWKYRGRKIRHSMRHAVARNVALLSMFLLLGSFVSIAGVRKLDVSYLIGREPLHFLFSHPRLYFTQGAAQQVYWYLLYAAVTTFVILVMLYFLCHSLYKRMVHRQKLARMIASNSFMESKVEEKELWTNGWKHKQETISYYPKMYYRVHKGYVYIRIAMDMSKHQSKFLDLGKEFENGLYCDLVEEVMEDGFVCYKLLYDVAINRINIEDMKANNGSIQLMKTAVWNYDSVPHALIAGGTGGGKTYFILALIEAFLKIGASIDIVDPKRADLADLEGVMPGRVKYAEGGIIPLIEKFKNDMISSWEEVKKRPDYVTGKNYAYYGLKPHILVFDEYAAFMEMLDFSAKSRVDSAMKQILMLGRQAGYLVILGVQRPDAEYIGGAMRDQFGLRVTLGKMYPVGYQMMYGEADKSFKHKNIKGRGYADLGYGSIQEFYSPFVPKDHNFLTSIGKLVEAQGAPVATATGGNRSEQADTNLEGA